jgi:osmotically inducible protein OsmC
METVMALRTADAEWRGNLAEGSGIMRLGSGTFEGPYDFRSRMGDGKGTSPEELLGAAHAGCFSMALALELAEAGFVVQHIHTTAKVHFGKDDSGWSVQTIDLETDGSVAGIAKAIFEEYAQRAKHSCPISKALSGVEINLRATLL